MRTPEPRYHALDSLRAIMMLLGIYLHVVVAYSTTGGWPYKQQELTSALNWTLGIIHLFRMPVFYVMAGFLGALLYGKRGIRGWLDNRLHRVAVPFVAGWLVLFPLVLFLTAVGKAGWGKAIGFIVTGEFLRYAHPMHLWFLEYLMLLYAGAVAAVSLVPAMPAARRWFRACAGSWWGPPIFAVPSFAALLPMHYAGLEDPPGFLPVPRIVVAYIVPFAFGWLLYAERDLLERFARRAWVYLSLSVAPLALYAGFVKFSVPKVVSFYGDRALHSIALWLLIYGFIGCFQRYLNGENQRMRYLSDSAYFLYLAHMPVIVALQLAMGRVAWPPLVKIPLVLVLATAVLVPMYHYLVRPTFIGAVLNGRRYPVGSRREQAVVVAA